VGNFYPGSLCASSRKCLMKIGESECASNKVNFIYWD